MKRHIRYPYFLVILTAVMLSSCSKLVTVVPGEQPEPQPVISDMSVITDDSIVNEILCRSDQAHGRIFIETTKSFSGGYNPYILCVDPSGKRLWGWTPLTDRKSTSIVNFTDFDVTTAGCVVDCFNVYDEVKGYNLPYINKLSTDGKPQWGEGGILLYDFGKNNSSADVPIGSYVVADSEGGAWIAAWTDIDTDAETDKKNELVVARVDVNGEKVTGDIIFDGTTGSSGEKNYVTRAQMYLGKNNDVFVLIQYSTINTSWYEGYYDLVRISADGIVLSTETLMSERIFFYNTRAVITRDNDGGAYISMTSLGPDDYLHVFLYHACADGTVDMKDIDITPEGCNSGIKISQVLDPQTGSVAVIMVCDSLDGKHVTVSEQVVSSVGEKLLGVNPKVVINLDTAKDNISPDNIKAIYMPDTRDIFLSYIFEPYMRLPVIKTSRLSFSGELKDEVEVVKVDVPYKISPDFESQRYCFIDGKLMYFFRTSGIKDKNHNFYGYCLYLK